MHERLREAGRRGNRVALVDAGHWLGDKEHVDVGDVVELATAALAHGDHGEPAACGVLRRLRTGDGECRFERRVGEIRDSRRHIDECGALREISRRDGEEPSTVGRPQRRECGVGSVARDRFT